MEFKHVLPADIERTSMKIIGGELEERGITVPPENEAVVKRVIHTTADFDYAENMRFTEDACRKGIEIFQKGGVTIVTDTNMAYSGISKPSLKKLGDDAHCYMADPEIMEAAKKAGTTRAVASMEQAAKDYPDSLVYAVGNAPTALIKIAEMIEAGLRPLMVIAVPVGFVNVVESKEYLMDTCEKYGIPAIAAMGRKGGSNVAACICNALLYQASNTLDPSARGWKG
ncbi:MAG: precorrin-8X methylmutase [Eubacteriales bacterium]|nr:precorrin-8X methylmutase [Eubacteriales bacterium]